ncbi:MAG: response regulator [Eubacteriales bacterium]|nr:response regulator [Eubacteriales bacterium]
MVKILIVDDEKIERKGICFLLKQREEEMEILEASNGKEACELLKQQPVDILFTDVKMPFMNGIELVAKARELQSDIEMVIFSGYGEFEYARQAMKSGVYNYVLKPVDPEEFHKTVDQLLEEINSRIRQREEKQWNQDSLEEYFFGKFLYHGDQEFLDKIKKRIDVKEWESIRQLILLESEDNFFEENEEIFVRDMTAEMQQKMKFFNLDKNEELCMLQSSCDQKVLAQHICSWVNSHFGERFYVAAGRDIQEVLEIPESFRELDTLMENKYYNKENRLFLPEKTLRESPAEQFLGDMLNNMIRDIQLEDMMHLWEHYHLLKNSIEGLEHYSQIYTKFMFSNLVKTFYEQLHMEGRKLEEAIQKVYELPSIQAVLQMVEKCIYNLEKHISETKSGSRDEVAKAKSYIYEHYNEDISVEVLADLVYLSPGYFSYIFKKETGVNLSRFVRMYRIEKAKELLENTNMKIVQICSETGFSNVSYFCKNFREYCGCSPEQFRKGEVPGE